ncbi:MAG: MFS transporter [Gammaproteobacteria bacterium]
MTVLNRNLIVLMSCQLVGALGSIILVTLGGIVGRELAANPALATLPLSAMVVCVALTTVPAALLMARIGRRRAFIASALVATAGVLLVALALVRESFFMLCVGTGLYGVHMAFVQQYRFAAVECVASEHASRAISLVLLGAIGGAVVGPILVAQGRDAVTDVAYVGTMLMLVVALLAAAVAMSLLRDTAVESKDERSTPPRPLLQIARSPGYLIAVLCAGVGYGVMTFVMTATPLSMHVHDGFTIEQTANVVRVHVIAMYAPSLVSGYLMARFGVRRMMTIGALLLMATLGVGVGGQELMHYTLALVALGVGWNFLYVGGTTLLTRTYLPRERFKAQALNDLTVFAMSATASLLSGSVMGWFGWQAVMAVAFPPLLIVLVALTILRGRASLAPPLAKNPSGN